MLKAYYHCKDYKNATFCATYDNGTSIRQIKNDMKGNNAVLDAIHNSKNNQVTIYSKRLTKGDVQANMD